MVDIYTDGSCVFTKGGWGYLIVVNDEVIKRCWGRVFDSTNNRMELTAVIESLKRESYNPIRIYSDSIYLIKGITIWINNWLKTDWHKGKVKNQDLWKELLDLTKDREITWNWVKAHDGNKYNEEADRLANAKIDILD